MSNEEALKKLNKFIDLRGEIAHNVKTTKSIQKKDVDEYRKFLNCVAVILHNKVVHHINGLVNIKPWDTYRYGSVR